MISLLPIFYTIDSFLLIFLILSVGILIWQYKPTRLLDYVLALILTSGTSEMIKYYINKPRPESIYIFEGSSFPSTHAATAACIVFFYLLVRHTPPNTLKGIGEALKKNVPTKDGILSLFIIFMGLAVALLRVELSAHDFTDIFAGIILGFVISCIFVFYDISGKRVR